MKLVLAFQILLAALSTAQSSVDVPCTNSLSGTLSLSVIPATVTGPAVRQIPLRLIPSSTSTSNNRISTMVTCSDCGLPELKWGLTRGVLQAGTSAVTYGDGIYNLDVGANEQPDFISTQVVPPFYPIYCAVPDSNTAKTGYLALRGTPKEFYSCANLTPTFAPTDRKDIYWKVNPSNSTWPRGACTRVSILYKIL